MQADSEIFVKFFSPSQNPCKQGPCWALPGRLPVIGKTTGRLEHALRFRPMHQTLNNPTLTQAAGPKAAHGRRSNCRPSNSPEHIQGTLKNSLFGLAGLFAPWRHRKKRRNMSPYAPFFALCQKAKILRDIRI
jgi:hypothetical protein